jgi:uroporphyrinogen III methyltransferase/synthase
VHCTLGTIADELERRSARPPAIVIVGKVVKHAAGLNWFTSRPLFGRRVMVTRPAEQTADIVHAFSSLGAAAILQPAIHIGPPTDWEPLDSAVSRLHDFDWVVFSSANGVHYLLERIWNRTGDVRALAKAKIAAIGPATADELAKYHLRADLVPNEYRAEALAAELLRHAGQQMLLIRASRGRELLADELRKAGRNVEQVVAYTNIDVDQPDPHVRELLASGQIHWITVTSSSIARSLAHMFGDDLKRARLASISPVTSAVLRELGFEPDAEAQAYTTEGLVQAIVDREQQAGPS